MADLATALYALWTADSGITAAISNRVYPVIVPQGVGFPNVRYQVISDPRPGHLKGANARRTARVQIDAFDTDHANSRAIARAFVNSMAGPTSAAGVTFNAARAEGPIDSGEDIDGQGFIHRARVDLLVEHDAD